MWTGSGRAVPLPRLFKDYYALLCLPAYLLAQSGQGAADGIPCVERRSIDYCD